MIITAGGVGSGVRFLDDDGNEIKGIRATSLQISYPGPGLPGVATITTIAPSITIQLRDENIEIKPEKAQPIWGRTTTHYA